MQKSTSVEVTEEQASRAINLFLSICEEGLGDDVVFHQITLGPRVCQELLEIYNSIKGEK